MEGYELFRVVATGVFVVFAMALFWTVYRIGKRTRASLVASLGLSLGSLALLTDSALERAAWVRLWPKSTFENVMAEACAILWTDQQYRDRSPVALVPVLYGALAAANRRLPGNDLRHMPQFLLWVAQTGDEDVCNSVGRSPFLGTLLDRAPPEAVAHYRAFVLAAARAELRPAPDTTYNTRQTSELMAIWARDIGPAGLHALASQNPKSRTNPTLSCAALRDLNLPLTKMPAKTLEDLVHATHQGQPTPRLPAD